MYTAVLSDYSIGMWDVYEILDSNGDYIRSVISKGAADNLLSHLNRIW